MKPAVLSPVVLSLLGLAGVAASQPSLAPVGEQLVYGGSPLHVPLDGSAAEGQALTFTAESSDATLVAATIVEGRRSLRMNVEGFGTMVFHLFDARVPRATGHIAELANGGFYDGVPFHRIIDRFVIQGGDPTGTGSGGSELGSFDDQFHVDLQHNRTGILSMAKAGDDSNDSQFFVTEGAQRHLDFNHSIFGLLVEGEDVRERISGVAVDSNDRPVEDVRMTEVRTFEDVQNAVLMLKAPEGATGAVDVTVVARNERGQEARETFRVNVLPDTFNTPPFLADVPEIVTKVDTPVTYQLEAIDVEGDPAKFLDQNGLTLNGFSVPVVAPQGLDYHVDFDSGLLTVTPSNGLTGRYQVSVGTAASVDAVDTQVVTIVIER